MMGASVQAGPGGRSEADTLVGAASYVGGDRAGVTSQVEGDLLAVAFGERVRAGPGRGRQERGPGCRP